MTTPEIGRKLNVNYVLEGSVQRYEQEVRIFVQLIDVRNDQQRFDISKEGLMACLQYYEKAIAADSNFVEAYAGLANAWYNLCAWGWYKPYFEGIKKAIYYCNRALQIDPDCAEAHAVKGVYHILP